MKPPSRENVTQVVLAWAEAIPFFPQSELGQSVVIDGLLKIVASTERLAWFYEFVLEHMPRYEGMPLLRALYASQFRPADGRRPVVDAPTIQAKEAEADYMARQMNEDEARMREYRRAALAAPAEDGEPFRLEEYLGPAIWTAPLPASPVPLPASPERKLLAAPSTPMENLPWNPGRSPEERDAEVRRITEELNKFKEPHNA